MSRTFVFLTLLLVSTYSIERKADSFNTIVDGLVELNSMIKAPADTVEGLVAQMKDSTKLSHESFISFYAGVEHNCEEGQRFIKDFSAKLAGDILANEVSVENAKKAIVKANADAAKYTEQIAVTRGSITESHKRHEEEVAKFRGSITEAENKLIVIRYIRNIIEDELLNAETPATLLQVNTISEKLAELKGLLEKSKDAMFGAVVTSLLSTVSEQNLNDQTTLRKILGGLDKIKANFEQFKKDSIKVNAEATKEFSEQSSALLKMMREQGKLIIESKGSVVGHGKHIDHLVAANVAIKGAIERKKGESTSWEALCNNQIEVKKVFMDGSKAAGDHLKQVGDEIMKLN